jgi:hypothetical protein
MQPLLLQKISLAIIQVTVPKFKILTTLLGKLQAKLADSTLGAIVSHALVTDNGEYVIASESGNVLYWKVDEKRVYFKASTYELENCYRYLAYSKSKTISCNVFSNYFAD